MKDWAPAGQIEGLFTKTSNLAATDPSDPQDTAVSSWNPVARITAGEALGEIAPGSEPINVMACVKRAFELTKRNFGMLLLVLITYFVVAWVINLIGSNLDVALGLKADAPSIFEPGYADSPNTSGPITTILDQLVAVFFSLGVARIGLNIVSGRAFTVGTLFSGGAKFLPAFGATFLYFLMVAIGLVLLIAPGIYLALRYGQYINAMVDRDLGVMDSFKYSSTITTNNRLNLFGLMGMVGVIILAGFLALCVGLFFAIPMAWLSWVVAYRWMQYGHRVALDHDGTTTPMLADRGI